MRLPVVLSLALFSATSVFAHAQDQTVSVGPWTIATSSKGDKFDSCTMSRSTSDLNITFVRGMTACSYFSIPRNGNSSAARLTMLL